MLTKTVYGLLTGIISYLSLSAVPYFPMGWVVSFAFIEVIVGYARLKIAITLAWATFAISLAYHSPPVFVLFTIIGLLCFILLRQFPEASLMILLIAGAPCLSALGPLLPPSEFLVVFLAPMLLSGKRITVTVALAGLWCLLIGIMTQKILMGNLVIGAPVYIFFNIQPLKHNFYDLSWLLSVWNPALSTNCLILAGQLGSFLLANPLILVQILLWVLSSQTLSKFLDIQSMKKKWWYGTLGIICAAGLLLALQIAVLFLSRVKIPFDMIRFSITLGAGALMTIGLWQWSRESSGHNLYDKINPASIPNFKLTDPGATDKPSLSLGEVMELQKELQDYVHKKFMRELTILDLDVAESARLKEGVDPKTVTACFKEFWKFADQMILSKGARLLNRAGDGTLYIFNNPNQAVVAAKEFLRKIHEFNQKKNTLASPFKVRQGINTGQILDDPAQKGSEVYSSVLDIAGHLQKLAQSNEILIAENTYKQLVYKSDLESWGISEKDNIPVYSYKLPS